MKFILEEQYQFYLQKVKLDESKMGRIQKRETRQAFFAGISQTILYCAGLAKMTDDEAVKELNNMLKQASDFWEIFNINNN